MRTGRRSAESNHLLRLTWPSAAARPQTLELLITEEHNNRHDLLGEISFSIKPGVQLNQQFVLTREQIDRIREAADADDPYKKSCRPSSRLS